MPQIVLIEDDVQFAAIVESQFESSSIPHHFYHLSNFSDFRKSGLTPDLILLDLGLPDGDGLGMIPGIREELPDTAITVITIFQDEDRIFKALRLGAIGYILKSDFTMIPEFARQILDGGALISQSIALRIAEFFQRTAARTYQPEDLSPREKQILDLIMNGFTVQNISEDLGTTPGTVRNQIKSIYRKLQVNSRSDLIRNFGQK